MPTLSALDIAEKVRRKDVSAETITQGYLEAIRKHEPSVNAFNRVYEEEALLQARSVDAKISAGQTVGALAGVPVAIKDNMLIKGLPCTCSSKILKNYVASYDGTVIRRLKEADAILIGHTNLDEFAMGSSTENSAFQTTKNPWDTARIPGGSSGGSAAAVAAGMAPLSLGSDTGGSIRQPAALCGIVGLKPTYGRVSRFGLVAFASSLDQIGPFARSAKDAALLMNVISGHDDRDSTSLNHAVPNYFEGLERDLKGLRIGLPKEYFIKGMDAEVESAVRTAVQVLERAGAMIKEISLPHTEYCLAVYYILAPSEASSNLSRFDGVRYGHRAAGAANLLELFEKSRGEGFGPEVKRRIMLGTYTLSSGYYDAYYAKAQKARTLIKQDFDNAFKDVDMIATPTSPSPAFKAGEKAADPLQMYLSDIFTISCNLAGIPGISIPCGFTKSRLPIGLQLLGRPLDEQTLLAVSHHYQETTHWHLEEPPLTQPPPAGRGKN